MQREILATLPESAAPEAWHRGMACYEDGEKPWHCVRGLDVMLASGIGDLMVARSIIAGRLGSGDLAGFPASFSRAVRTLAARGEIMLLSRVPIIAYRRAAYRLRQVLRISAARASTARRDDRGQPAGLTHDRPSAGAQSHDRRPCARPGRPDARIEQPYRQERDRGPAQRATFARNKGRVAKASRVVAAGCGRWRWTCLRAVCRTADRAACPVFPGLAGLAGHGGARGPRQRSALCPCGSCYASRVRR